MASVIAGWSASSSATAAVPTLPSAVEDYSYPGAAQILANQNITLKSGDGNIVLADCASGSGLVQLYSRAATPSEVCFKITGPTGYLALEIPQVYNIKGDDHAIKATLSTAGTVSSVDINKNAWTPVGEGSAPGDATLLELNATGGTAAPAGTNPTPAVGTLAVGQPGHPGSLACTATLVAPQWVLSAASCFPPATGPLGTMAPVPAATTATIGSHTVAVAEYDTYASDRDLVMVRLAQPVTDVTPIPVSGTAPAAGENLQVVGFGRTKTEWRPSSPHSATFTVGTVNATDLAVTPSTPADAVLCQGDAGAPALRAKGNGFEIVAVTGHSGQSGCLGATDTATGATESRTDDLGAWVTFLRTTEPGWKTPVLVNGDSSLYRSVRFGDGSTAFTNVETSYGSIGGVRAFATAGINGDTHIVALGGDGHLHHVFVPQPTTAPVQAASRFGDVNDAGAAGPLTNITQVATVSIGLDLHVVAVANGRVYHAIRHADGTWTKFGDVESGGGAGNLAAITSVAVASTSGGQLQVAVVANGKVYHTIRAASGVWGTWGDVAQAAGATGPVNSVAMAGSGGDAQMVIITDNGAHQYHTIRYASGSWAAFGDLAGVWGQLNAKSAGGTVINGELQLSVATSDNRVLNVVRHADRTWSAAAPVDLTGISGSHDKVAVTATYNG
ncbi:trypsin-like serine protease [Streptomyces tateyamensis]|uniref:trypsin-like serine protease n=1 Tax=Streptomyces tateyamensis TaxID=565073 RepID=UPI0015E8A931|nr:trypsin-like serine protease [Streptomyces tateyamensis]